MKPLDDQPTMWVQSGRTRRRAKVSKNALLAWGNSQLQEVGAGPMEATWLLEWALETPSLVTAPDEVGIRTAEKYRSAIAQRRARIPLQHITGEMAFRYLTLTAGAGVFSVRPETEGLVDIALEASPENWATADRDTADRAPLQVADLCAGSGAVGLALANERENTQVALVELDPTAASYLRKNAANTPKADGSDAQVYVEDATEALPGKEGTFDLVLSNPPYVSHAEAPTQAEAQADPIMSLFGGGEDGLVVPRGVVGRAFELLKDGGTLVMEHGENQGEALRDHARSVGFSSAETQQDLTGRDRYLVAVKS